MHPIQQMRLVWGFIALGAILGGVVQAQPEPQPPVVDRGGTVIVPVGGAVRFQMKSKRPITNARTFRKENVPIAVNADPTDPSYVVLTGLVQGTDRLELTDNAGKKEVYDIVVQTDLELLKSVLKRSVPTAHIDIIPFANNGAVITGTVAYTADADTIMRIATTLINGRAAAGQSGGNQNIINAMQVGGVNQVQLDVTVARVDRTKARTRGVSFAVNGSTVSVGSILGPLATSAGSSGNSTVASGIGVIPGAASLLPTPSANLVFGIIPAQFQGLLQALKTEGLAKLIAEPKLVTQSGRAAHFISGGQQATLSAASGINGPGVSYVDIGTELDFLPIVYGNGKIYLEVKPRVRSVNTALGVTTSFGTVPGFDEQSVTTSVVMESGQTFAIGGLIQTTVQASAAKTPVLGEIPFFGALFSVVSYSEEEQEMVILVTPHLVDPMDCNQVPRRIPGAETRGPDDYELFLDSMLELPRGQRKLFEGWHYKAGWKNDPTAGTFPCGVGDGRGACNTGNCAAPVIEAPNGQPLPAMGPGGTAPMSLNQLPRALPVPQDIPVPPKELR